MMPYHRPIQRASANTSLTAGDDFEIKIGHGLKAKQSDKIVAMYSYLVCW